MLENLEYNAPYLHSVIVTPNGLIRKIYLVRVMVKTSNNDFHDNYYLKSYLSLDGKEFLEGYLYFSIDVNLSLSSFIGIFVKEEYRSLGLSSLLLANFIDLSFNNNLTNIVANKTQKKPFIIYLLKKFGFELDDVSLYETLKSVIFICKVKDSNAKAIFFRSPFLKETFKKSRSCQKDNYLVLESLSAADTVLTPILLNHEYKVHQTDQTKCYQKVLEVFKKTKG